MEQIKCNQCPLRKLSLFRASIEEELSYIQEFKRGELQVDPGSTLLHEGTSAPHIYTVLDGWAYRSKTTEDGHTQILNFALPGDLLGLQTAIMGEMDHTVVALTAMRLCVFERARVWELFTHHPNLSFALTWIASREERILDQHLLSVGQHTGLQKVAYLLLFLFDRASKLGLSKGSTCQMPLTQSHIAQALGLTNVHVSRMCGTLASRGIMQFKNGQIKLLDREKAEKLAEYSFNSKEVDRPIL